MAHRRFTDAEGNAWDVWEVHPSRIERRAGISTPPKGLDRRHYDDHDIRIRLSPELSGGWLAFESHGVRLRLAPIPQGWERFDDSRLVLALRDAKAVKRTGGVLE